MIRMSHVAAGLFSLGLVFAPGLSSAAVIQTAQDLMSVCPALSSGTGCPEGAQAYLDAVQPSNAQIVSLVSSIAGAADTPQVPKPICLDAAQGIRVLGEGVSNSGQRQQIFVIADELCQGLATAAIPTLSGADFNNGNGYFSPLGGAGVNGGTGGDGGDTGGTGNGGSGGTGGDGGNGGTVDDGGTGGGGEGGVCAGNSSPGNGNNCTNNNQSHSH